jgi:hypothetical protein
VGALYGGWQLVTDPTGGSMQMPLTYLQHSPFTNYLIPGIILLLANGVGSFVVLGLIMFTNRCYSLAIVAEGFILGGWITIQMLMLRTANPLQLFYFATALLLVVTGTALWRIKQVK